MYQRFDLTPIAVKQWNSIVYATDLNGKTRFLTIDFVFFYLTPLMAACVLAAFLGNHRPAVEFLSKFAILLTPLMLNLVFHVLRLQGDLKKAVPPPGKPLLDALADTCSSVRASAHPGVAWQDRWLARIVFCL